MKKLIVIVFALMLSLSCLTLFGCAKNVEITFVQDGPENIVKTIEKGETLVDIPVPVAKDGYTVTWDVDDFSNIDEDITVNAVYTANEYVITYEINKEHASITAETQKVTFDKEFTLLTPTTTRSDVKFSHWCIKGTNDKFAADTVYNIPDDVTLVAKWVPVGGGEWSENA